jgi:hypothetical protein
LRKHDQIVCSLTWSSEGKKLSPAPIYWTIIELSPGSLNPLLIGGAEGGPVCHY